MVYAFKRTYRKRRYRRRYRKGANLAKTISRVMSGKAEKKINETLYANAECDWAGRMHTYNTIAGGTAYNQRVGRAVKPYGIGYNFTIANSNQNLPHTWSLIWFRDTQQVGDTNPTPSQLLNSSAVGTVQAPNSMLNINNRGRFKVIKRLTFCIQDRDSGLAQRVIKGYIKLRNSPEIRYNGSGSTDIERNGLYLLLISSSDPLNDDSYVSGETRMYYTDV